MKTIKINNVEYECETHDFNKMLSEIKIPKGWRLLKPSEAMMLWELKQFTDWFFVKQVIKKFKGKSVARFYADSDGAGLGCSRDADYRDAGLGVRFCRDLKVKK